MREQPRRSRAQSAPIEYVGVAEENRDHSPITGGRIPPSVWNRFDQCGRIRASRVPPCDAEQPVVLHAVCAQSAGEDSSAAGSVNDRVRRELLAVVERKAPIAVGPPHVPHPRPDQLRARIDRGVPQHDLEPVPLDVPSVAVRAVELVPGVQPVAAPSRTVRPARIASQRRERVPHPKAE